MADLHNTFIDAELNDLLALESGLSEWEVGFIESVQRQIERGKTLSPKQASKLHQIWDKHCG